MRPAPALLLATLLATALAACGHGDGRTPSACLQGGGSYLRALDRLPGPVEIDDGVRISDCLPENQQAGQLAAVGGTMVTLATKLNSLARQDPGGKSNLELGYLLGAAQHAADRNEGIDAELIRRLTVAARYSPDNRPLPAELLRTYREGFDLGLTEG
jgi:hypothetical protein